MFSVDSVCSFTTMAEGFVTQTISNTLRPGEDYVVPPITMSLAMVVTEVRVSPSTEEIAQEEFKELEQQRVLGIVRILRLGENNSRFSHGPGAGVGVK